MGSLNGKTIFIYLSSHLPPELALTFHFLRVPRTQRSECCVCQQRTRAWSRAWVLHRASCSSFQPSLPSPAPCSSRWEASVQLRAPQTAAKLTQNYNLYYFYTAGEWESPEQSAAAGALPAAARWAAFTAGAEERAKWVEERRGAEETRGQSEGAAAGVG